MITKIAHTAMKVTDMERAARRPGESLDCVSENL